MEVTCSGGGYWSVEWVARREAHGKARSNVLRQKTTAARQLRVKHQDKAAKAGSGASALGEGQSP